jgi:DNA-binding transcriptional regulator YiaG
MAEAEFAQALCISLVTLPDWEPGRCGRIRRLGLFC